MTVYRASLMQHRRARTLVPMDLAEPLIIDRLRALVTPLGRGHCLEVRAGEVKIQWIHPALGAPQLLMFCTPVPPRVLRTATAAQRAELLARGFSLIGTTAFLASHEMPIPPEEGIVQLARSGLAILSLAYGLDTGAEVTVSMRDMRASRAQKVAFATVLVATAAPALFWTVTTSGPAARLVAMQSWVFHDGQYSPRTAFALLWTLLMLGVLAVALPTHWAIVRARTVRE